MKNNESYWEIRLEKHTKIIFEGKINSKHISENNLIKFIKVILSKYTLSDTEILETYTSIPFQKRKEYISVTRSNNNLKDPLKIYFDAQLADYSIIVSLVK